MDQTIPTDLKAILTEMATLTTMERGKLTAEYRSRPASDGTGRPVKSGPYYKLQAWEKGRNASRRIPPQAVAALQEDLANHERFAQLADAFVEQTIARTREMRRSAELAQEAPAAKKNSAKKPAGNVTAKRKPSSAKSKRA
jgi:hypothetical protein